MFLAFLFVCLFVCCCLVVVVVFVVAVLRFGGFVFCFVLFVCAL